MKVLLDEMPPVGVRELLQPDASDSELELTLAKSALEIGPGHDSENEDDVALLDSVVHHAIIANAKSVKVVADSADGFDGLAADASLAWSVTRQFSTACRTLARTWTGSL